jgi:DNA mismatch endonuclease, patch repair protein
MPKSNVDFWHDKFTANVARDSLAYSKLTALGWRVMVIWECETKDEDALIEKFRASFDDVPSLQ